MFFYEKDEKRIPFGKAVMDSNIMEIKRGDE